MLSDHPIKKNGGGWVLIRKGNQNKSFPPKRLAGIRTKTSFVMLMLQSWHYVRLLHGFIVYHIYITLNMQFVNYHIMEHQLKLFKRPNLKLVCPFC